jgi:hypothetical protein
MDKPRLPYAVLAEFADPAALVDAVRACQARYGNVDAYSPYPIEALKGVMPMRGNRVALWTLLGGLAGGAGAYFLQWYTAVVDYPINAGGRPLHSWPAFVPATFELTVLGACLAAFIAMLVLSGLPRLHHPLFAAPDFDLATRNRFFVAVRGDDAAFDRQAAHAFLDSLHPVRVFEVDA